MQRITTALATLLLASSASACTFSWHNLGDEGIRERVAEKIGAAVTDKYCKLYNSSHEIIVMFDSFSDSKMSLGYASVAVRKRGSKEFPAKRSSAYRSDSGNYTKAYAKDLAALATIDALTELMDDLDSYARTKN